MSEKMIRMLLKEFDYDKNTLQDTKDFLNYIINEIDKKIKGVKEMVAWSYFDKYDKLNNQYVPDMGEGETLATQTTTALAKLIYKWYNDGDVYDNNYYMQGWCNDLSSYANWLAKHIDGAKEILDRISETRTDSEYEHILKDLSELIYDEEYLKRLNEQPKEDSIYTCEGDYSFNENKDEEEF